MSGIYHALKTSRLLVMAGSGGVGKTTIAASAALEAARAGRRVAVLTIDPARRLAQALGFETFSGELTRVALEPEVPGELWALMLDIKTTGDAMVHRFASSPEVAQAILKNPYYGYFSTSLAGSQEYMAVEQVRALIEDQNFDLVVLDTPPAQNALDFFDAPERLIDGLRSIPMRAIGATKSEGITGRLASRGRGLILRGLNRLTGGPFLEELAEFLGLFHTTLDALTVSSARVQRLLRAPTTKFFLVTTPTAGRIDEAIAFRSELRRRGFPMGGFVLNRVHHPIVPVPVKAAQSAMHALEVSVLKDAGAERRDALILGLVDVVAQHNVLAHRDGHVATRLHEVTERTPFQVPHFPMGVHDLEGLAAVGHALVGEGT
jgi:anion-transporting  ArsA/GET3 family ATPase